MSALKVPTIFTAIDKFTSVVGGMQKSVTAFANKTEAEVARVQRSFRKVSEVSKSIAVGTAAAGAAIAAPLAVAVNYAMDYETAIASLSAITGATGDELLKFKTKVEQVGDTTKMSYNDVAKAFELVGSAKPELLASSDALGKVTESAILLSKASRADLESSVRSLTGVMNQFSLDSEQSGRTINVLAAGAKVGAATIAQTAESMVNFGSVAAGANMSVEQATAAIQVMSKYSLFGAEAGTKLRGSVLKLQQAGVGYASGQFEINDALREAKSRIDKLKTAQEKDAAVLKMFGAENITTGKILLSNIDTFQEQTKGVTGTSEANLQAAANSATLAEKIKELKNQAQNLAIKIGEILLPVLTNIAERVLPMVLSLSKWASENKQLVKSIVYVATAAAGLLIFVSVISSIISVVSWAAATFKFMLVAGMALKSMFVSYLIPALQVLWAIFTTIIEVMAAAAGVTTGVFLAIGAAIAFVISLVMSFIRNWEMIKKAFKTDGIIGGLKAIGATILDAILLPLQKVLELASKLPKFLGGGLAADAASGIEGLRERMGVNMGDPAATAKPVVNPKLQEQNSMISKMQTTNTNKNVTLDFKNLPKGTEFSGDGVGSSMPQLGSTLAF